MCLINFFLVDGPILTTAEYPADLDTTSIGLMVTQPEGHVFDSVMDEILQYMSEDGIAMVRTRGLHLLSRCD